MNIVEGGFIISYLCHLQEVLLYSKVLRGWSWEETGDAPFLIAFAELRTQIGSFELTALKQSITPRSFPDTCSIETESGWEICMHFLIFH